MSSGEYRAGRAAAQLKTAVDEALGRKSNANVRRLALGDMDETEFRALRATRTRPQQRRSDSPAKEPGSRRASPAGAGFSPASPTSGRTGSNRPPVTARAQRRWSTSYRTPQGDRPLDVLLFFEAGSHAVLQVALEEVAAAADLSAYATKHPRLYEVNAAADAASFTIFFTIDPDDENVLLGLSVATPADSYEESLETALARLPEWGASRHGTQH